jgi:DNA-binding GntR family transcriptional regulator
MRFTSTGLHHGRHFTPAGDRLSEFGGSTRVLTRPDDGAEDTDRAVFGVPNYQRVRDAIRSDIARGNFAPNARLKIGELTARYGLSPAPIREALNQLAAEGWVVIHPNRGAQVRDIDETFFREMNEVRVALESYTVGLCAAVARPADVERLEQIEDEFESTLAAVTKRSKTEVMRDADASALLRINTRLHDAIHAIRPNREAKLLSGRYRSFFNTMRMARGYGVRRPDAMASEHRALLAAFRASDVTAAERISREHVTHAMEDLLAIWRKGSGG